MRIVILTQYYPPEVGAPQNRLHTLALDMMKQGHDVSILTAMPNYPQMKIYSPYRRKIFVDEEIDGVKVLRSWIFVSKSKSFIFRLLNYFSFVFSSILVGILKLDRHDVLLLESPPLFLSISAVFLCKLKGMKLVTNVSDLWPESAVSLGLVKNKFLISLASALEKSMYEQSDFISGQTRGIVDDIKRRFPHKNVVWFPNGAELDYFNGGGADSHLRSKLGFKKSDFVLGYAGILGHAQGLQILIDAATLLKDEKRFQWLIVGEGPEKKSLQTEVEARGLDCVHFHPFILKSEVPDMLKCFDAAVVPLKKTPLFLGAIPSKIFETLAMRVPLILGVEGEAYRLFVEEGECAWPFRTEDAQDLSQVVKDLEADSHLMKIRAERGLEYVSKVFDRKKINLEFITKLKEI